MLGEIPKIDLKKCWLYKQYIKHLLRFSTFNLVKSCFIRLSAFEAWILMVTPWLHCSTRPGLRTSWDEIYWKGLLEQPELEDAMQKLRKLSFKTQKDQTSLKIFFQTKPGFNMIQPARLAILVATNWESTRINDSMNAKHRVAVTSLLSLETCGFHQQIWRTGLNQLKYGWYSSPKPSKSIPNPAIGIIDANWDMKVWNSPHLRVPSGNLT